MKTPKPTRVYPYPPTGKVVSMEAWKNMAVARKKGSPVVLRGSSKDPLPAA